MRGATYALAHHLLHSEVSIHAPRAGCDCLDRLHRYTSARFNSRTPCGVRLGAMLEKDKIQAFQFTHPVRGATQRVVKRKPVDGVSIHAPRAGCDQLGGQITPMKRLFQFTHPVRGATASRSASLSLKAFQFTHPVRGATTIWRPNITSNTLFQFTHPVRGATTEQEASPWRRSFQFTHPVRGATFGSWLSRDRGSCFNSRTPCGVRQVRHADYRHRITVSIHAPRAGCDRNN